MECPPFDPKLKKGANFNVLFLIEANSQCSKILFQLLTYKMHKFGAIMLLNLLSMIFPRNS